MSSSIFFTGIAVNKVSNQKSKIKEKLLKKREEDKSLESNAPINQINKINANIQLHNSTENKEKFAAMHKRSYSSLMEKRKKKVEEENFNSKAEQYLVDFMINDETKFADLNQIENYYKSEIEKNNKIFDINRTKIDKQNGELEALDLNIEKELLDNHEYDCEEVIRDYEEEKNGIRLEMGNKEHDFVCFEKLRDELIGKKVCIRFFLCF